MKHFNELMLVGTVGINAELRHTRAGQQYAYVRMVTDEHYNNPQGQWQKVATWHSLKFWGSGAQRFVERMRKGKTAWIKGQVRFYKGSDDRRHCEVKVREYGVYDDSTRPRSFEDDNQIEENQSYTLLGPEDPQDAPAYPPFGEGWMKR